MQNKSNGSMPPNFLYLCNFWIDCWMCAKSQKTYVMNRFSSFHGRYVVISQVVGEQPISSSVGIILYLPL